MDMYNPPHPGEIVREDCLKALDLTVTEAAKGLGVTRKTLSSILNGHSGVTAERLCGYPRRSEVRRSIGCRCSLPMICGKRSAAPKSCTLSSSSPQRQANGCSGAVSRFVTEYLMPKDASSSKPRPGSSSM